jgi:hypothetical protein
VQSPCSPLIEDYTELFYVNDKGDITFIQCKMSLREPKSVRKVHGLSLFFIDFYIPALTPRLNSTENSLQLSENINLTAVCRVYTDVISASQCQARCGPCNRRLSLFNGMQN